jgi:metal-responsive CopG/Arc/MetJ family transcriptional regulator
MKTKYKTIMIKESLHQELDFLCREKGFKTTSELLNYLIQKEYQETNNIKNQLFNENK